MKVRMQKTTMIVGLVLSLSIITAATMFTFDEVNAETTMTVYKSATCGCCEKWITHMEENGFKVKGIDVQNMDVVKQKYGISRQIASCHTAIVDGYVVEGHVPASDVKKLLAEKKDVIGLSVPGMPMGSPGMEMGDRVDRYDVVSFDKEGNLEIWKRY